VDTTQWGSGKLLSSHAGGPRSATGDTAKAGQTPRGRQWQRESARRRPRTQPHRPDVNRSRQQPFTEWQSTGAAGCWPRHRDVAEALARCVHARIRREPADVCLRAAGPIASCTGSTTTRARSSCSALNTGATSTARGDTQRSSDPLRQGRARSAGRPSMARPRASSGPRRVTSAARRGVLAQAECLQDAIEVQLGEPT
jgi:hypothetical protein